MEIVVIGGSGPIRSKLVKKLREHGHNVLSASPDSGVDMGHQVALSVFGTDGRTIRLPPVLIQAESGDDVADALADTAGDPPVRGIVEKS